MTFSNMLVSSLMILMNHPLSSKCLIWFILIYISRSSRAYQPSNIIRQTTAYSACLLVTSLFIHVFCFLSRHERVNNAVLFLCLFSCIYTHAYTTRLRCGHVCLVGMNVVDIDDDDPISEQLTIINDD